MNANVPGSVNTSIQTTDSKVHSVDMRTQVHRGVEGLRSLRKQWEELHRFCELWSRFEWYLAYVSHLAVDSERIYFIQVIAGEETVAIIPAEISRQRIDPFGKLKILCLAFHSHLAITDFPLNPHVDPAVVAEQMLEALRKLPDRWDVIRWPRIMHSSSAMQVVRSIRGYSVHSRQASLCNFIDTNKTYDELFNSLPSKRRSNLRRMRKALAETADWHVTSNSVTEESGQSYETFLRLEASGWKGESGTGSAIILDNNTRDFYASLLEQRKADFIPEVILLTCGSNAIAGQFTIWTQGCMYGLKMGHDECYAKLSPGQILMEEVVRSACESTPTARVNMITDTSWQHKWLPKQEVTYDVIIFRRWLPGLLYGCYLHARRLAKLGLTLVKDVCGPKNPGQVKLEATLKSGQFSICDRQ